MASNIQILLPFIYVVFGEAHYIDPFNFQYDMNFNQHGVNGRPNNDNFYRPQFNLPLDPNYVHPESYPNPNFDNMPLPNNLNAPGKIPYTQFGKELSDEQDVKIENNQGVPHTENSDYKKDNPENSIETPTTESNNDKKENITNSNGTSTDIKSVAIINQLCEEQKDKSTHPLEDTPPKTNEVKNETCSVALTANKDYIMVDNTGSAYLLYENTPDRGYTNNIQPSGNNAVYAPVTANKNVVQQPSNQIYQVVNGQPTTVTSNNAVPVSYQLPAGNVIYLPISNTNNQQQPVNQIYQVVNKQPFSSPITNSNYQQQPGIQIYQPVNGQPISTNIPSTYNQQQPGNQNYQTSNGQPIYAYIQNTNNKQQPGNQVYQTINGHPVSINVPNANNQQQPSNQIYQVSSGQPIYTNVPNTNNAQQSGNQNNQGINRQPISTNSPNTYNQQQPSNQVYQVITGQPISTGVSNTNNPQQPGNQIYQVASGQPTSTYIPNTNSQQHPGNQIYQVVNGQPSSTNIPNTNSPQQPGNQNYQVANGQPISTNTLFTSNRPISNGYSNVIANPVQSNSPTNNYNPSSILIYANGQWIQIPGVVVNPQQNNAPTQNGYYVPAQTVPNNNVNAQNGNGQSNNNLGLYSAPNNYIQPNYNNQNQNPVGTQNPNVKPVTYSVGNNANINQQPSPQKDESVVFPNQNNGRNTQDQPKTSQGGSNYIVAQPAIMVSGFKGKDNNKEYDKKNNKSKGTFNGLSKDRDDEEVLEQKKQDS